MFTREHYEFIAKEFCEFIDVFPISLEMQEGAAAFMGYLSGAFFMTEDNFDPQKFALATRIQPFDDFQLETMKKMRDIERANHGG